MIRPDCQDVTPPTYRLLTKQSFLTRSTRSICRNGQLLLQCMNSSKLFSYRSVTVILIVYVFATTLHMLHAAFLTTVADHATSSLSLPLGLGHQPAEPKLAKVRPLEEHTYTPDGLLVVNPNGSHPIFDLIHKAETEWEAKLARASKTLDAAVVEYKRRYRRPPPLGFDRWWDYVVKHDVRLPDEYDEIYHDLEPFWGIDPYDLAITQEELEHRTQIVTVQKTPSGRASAPPMLSDWRIKNMALEAAARGTIPLPQGRPVPTTYPCATFLALCDAAPPRHPSTWCRTVGRLGRMQKRRVTCRWDMKVDERLAWRGSTTGIHASPTSLWIHAHRARLVTLANTLVGNVSVLPVPADASTPVGDLKRRWDVQGNGVAVGVQEMAGRSQEGRYKFIFDCARTGGRILTTDVRDVQIDGNGWSSRFKRLITSNSLVFKATIYPEWFMSRIAPWVHYVPIQISYTDLYDAVAFFRAHDDLAAHIAAAGKEWSQHFWRKEDMSAYLYRLLLEYARVSSLDRASMNYAG
ncbi:glycosyl transferase family 90-domain-containing protein [Melanogaster broomeanus]|nr:glycosyl transferase family 90-domain-containing protein [Melanogaster broomeanus]